MFEFLLSIRVSFRLVRVGRMPRQVCCNTPPFLAKTSLCSVSFFFFVEAAEWTKGSKRHTYFLAHWSGRCHLTKYTGRLVWAHHQCRMWHRQFLSAFSLSLQRYWHFLGALKLETGWMALVTGGFRLRPLESRPSSPAHWKGWAESLGHWSCVAELGADCHTHM